LRKKPEIKPTVAVDVGLDKLGAALSRFADSVERLLDADARNEAKAKKQVEDLFILERSHDPRDR
jgi:hypothetical protein